MSARIFKSLSTDRRISRLSRKNTMTFTRSDARCESLMRKYVAALPRHSILAWNSASRWPTPSPPRPNPQLTCDDGPSTSSGAPRPGHPGQGPRTPARLCLSKLYPPAQQRAAQSLPEGRAAWPDSPLPQVPFWPRRVWNGRAISPRPWPTLAAREPLIPVPAAPICRPGVLFPPRLATRNLHSLPRGCLTYPR